MSVGDTISALITDLKVNLLPYLIPEFFRVFDAFLVQLLVVIEARNMCSVCQVLGRVIDLLHCDRQLKILITKIFYSNTEFKPKNTQRNL